MNDQFECIRSHPHLKKITKHKTTLEVEARVLSKMGI